MKIIIVLPIYNEAENLPRLIPKILELPLPNLHLLIIDDNSPDGSGEIAEALSQKYPGRIKVKHRSGKLGLGSAYRLGFRMAIEDNADVIVQMDSDFSHPVDKIPEILKNTNLYDISIGSRYIPGGSVDINWPLWRKGLSAWGNFYARTILNLPVRDVTGGFRFWKKETLQAIPIEDIKSNGYIFQVEIAYIAHKLGFSFGEIPIYFADRKWGKSKMNFRIQVEAAIRVWQVLWNYRNLKTR